jgi:hypothetical protein
MDGRMREGRGRRICMQYLGDVEACAGRRGLFEL